MKIITNNVPRFTLDSYELTAEERAQFDYLDWDKLDKGEDSATFFRYAGDTYDLGEFSTTRGISRDSGLPDSLNGWHGYISDTYFSGIVVRYTDDFESVVVGRFYA